MKIVDRVFGWLLVFGGVMHAWGSWTSYRDDPTTLVWALSGSVAAILLASINLLRVARPNDQELATISLIGCVAWMCVALGFGKTIGNVADPRAVIHAVNALVLAVMSARTLWNGRDVRHHST